MNIQDVIGELLYIGIVAEKGRCYKKVWRFGYKRILYKHVAALNELQKWTITAHPSGFRANSAQLPIKMTMERTQI